MARSGSPTFDQCETVYTVGREGEQALLILRDAAAVTLLVGVWDAARHFADSQSLSSGDWWFLLALFGVVSVLGYGFSRLRRESRVGIHRDGLLLRNWPWPRVLIPWQRLTGMVQEDVETQRRAVPESGDRIVIHRESRLTIRTRRENGRTGSVCIASCRPAVGTRTVDPPHEPICQITIAGELPPDSRQRLTHHDGVLRAIDDVRDAVISRAHLSAAGEPEVSSHRGGVPIRPDTVPTITRTVKRWERRSPSGGTHRGRRA